MLTELRRIVESMAEANTLEQALRHWKPDPARHDGGLLLRLCSRAGHAPLSTGCDRWSGRIGRGQGHLPFEQGIVGLVGQREELINLADAPHPSFKFLPDVAEEAFRSFLGAPIMHQRQVVGILVVQQKESRLFDEGEESFMVTLAAQLAARIAQAQAKGGCRRPTGKAAARYCRASGIAIAKAWCGVRARRSIPSRRAGRGSCQAACPSRAGGGGGAP